jgi:nitrite reductase/ring-hydroxylating ferredoxin subunit
VSEFPIGEFRLFDLPRGSVGVLRTDDGIYAVRNRCPHMGGPICTGEFGGTTLPSAPDEIVYGLRDDVLRCPWHGWEFRVSTGDAVFNMSKRRLIKYPVEIIDGRVIVTA